MSFSDGKPKIIGMIPAYNCAHLLKKAYEQVPKEYFDDIIVIDDGSTDDTFAVAKTLPAKAFTHEHSGYGGNIKFAIRKALELGADYMIEIHGDGQYDPAELTTLLAHMEPSVGLVNGYKVKRSDPFHRIVIGKVYNAMARRLFGISLRDIDCDFRLLRRTLLEQARLQYDSGVICVEMVYKLERLSCRVVEVQVSHYPRVAGRSQFFRWRAILTTLAQLASIYFSRWEAPAARRDVAELNPK